MKYNKLIRDKIPEKIKANGENYIIHIAGDDEYLEKIRKKLGEEIQEYLKNPCIEELADIEEVIRAISKFEFGGYDELERVRVKKAEELGSLEKRIVLDETERR